MSITKSKTGTQRATEWDSHMETDNAFTNVATDPSLFGTLTFTAWTCSALRKVTDLPIAAGFGISTAEHVQAVTRHADAAIVGSALVGRMGRAKDPAVEARKMVSELARGLSTHRKE